MYFSSTFQPYNVKRERLLNSFANENMQPGSIMVLSTLFILRVTHPVSIRILRILYITLYAPTHRMTPDT